MDSLFEDSESDNEINRSPDCGVLSFHNGTEEALFIHLKKNFSYINDSSSEEMCCHCCNLDKLNTCKTLLKIIDNFCYTRHWMMHIGDKKSVKLVEIILSITRTTKRPCVFVELGWML